MQIQPKGPRKTMSINIKPKHFDMMFRTVDSQLKPVENIKPKSTTYLSPIYLIYPTIDHQSLLTKKGSIYLSNISAAKNRASLDSFQIKRIVNLCSGNDGCNYTYDPNEIKCMPIKMDDTSYVKLAPVICETYPFISDGLTNGENVLVHCQMGISRSVSIIIAFLILYDLDWVNSLKLHEETNFNCLYRHIKQIKDDIDPNLGFVLQLEELSTKWDEFQTKYCQ